MAEWLKAPDSKSGVLARVPGVQIPPLPPTLEIRTVNQNWSLIVVACSQRFSRTPEHPESSRSHPALASQRSTFSSGAETAMGLQTAVGQRGALALALALAVLSRASAWARIAAEACFNRGGQEKRGAFVGS